MVLGKRESSLFFISGFVVSALVDGGNLVYPAATFAVLQIQNGFRRPVKVIGDKGYLLIEQLKGVA